VPRQTEAAALTPSALTRELAVLEEARGALTRHDPARALRALDDYRLAFPGGTLHIEAAALRVEAVAQSGNVTRAGQLAEAFLASYPNSPLTARVRAVASSAAKTP
jgi:hypothetical protein